MKELIIVQTFDKDGFFAGYEVKGEVVRCKDCKYTNAHGTDAHGNVDVHCVLFNLWMKEDFYCADGRRKG